MNCRVALCEFDSIFLEKSWIWLNDPYINYYLDAGPIDKEKQLEWFNSLQDRDDYMIWGVKYLDKPIGACGLKNIKDNWAEYWGYIGEKDLHGMGLGYEMMIALLSKAKKMNFSNIVLKVLPDNQRAIHLYQRCSFSEYNKDDTYLYMKKIL